MLVKTTILPTDDPPLAQRMFHDLIHQEAVVLFVGLGATEEIEKMVGRADKLAGLVGEPRWVVWARKPGHVQPVIDELDVPAALGPRMQGARAFTLNFDDKVRDAIGSDEPEPGMTRILLAYARAEVD